MDLQQMVWELSYWTYTQEPLDLQIQCWSFEQAYKKNNKIDIDK